MQNTPNSNRRHVAILGETNSGKSALFNAIMGVQTAIVSDVSGTTTDPVYKAMELLPHGPIVLIDTAGLGDASALGAERVAKTKEVLNRADYAIYAIDVNRYDEKEYERMKRELDDRGIPHTVAFTKKDVSDIGRLARLSKKYENTIIVSVVDQPSIDALKLKIAEGLEQLGGAREDLIGGLVPPGGVVVMVVPIDSGAPKGRLILPQVQLLRDCLDNGVRCVVTLVEYLERTLSETQRIDLVVTDSQVFGPVKNIVPRDIPLTSFSLLMARQKGDIRELAAGARAVAALRDGDRVLIAEVCVHNRSHEDIGRVKIPAMLRQITGKALEFDFVSGKDFPEDLSRYALAAHCGGCMMTPREMRSRMERCRRAGVPITNYGVVLAYGSGVLDRSMEIFENENDNDTDID